MFYAEVIEEQLNTLEEIKILDFFKSGFTLTSDDRFAKFDLSLSPWIAALCEWFDDPKTDWIFLIQGSQTCKTTFMMGVLLHVSQNISGAVPCLWVSSLEEEAKIFVSDRLKPFLEGSIGRRFVLITQRIGQVTVIPYQESQVRRNLLIDLSRPLLVRFNFGAIVQVGGDEGAVLVRLSDRFNRQA